MISFGPLDARILIVGEAPGAEEERLRLPFVGESGKELTKILTEASINRATCFLTNITSHRPPGNDIELFFYGKKEAKLLGLMPTMGRFPKKQILEGMEELWEIINKIKPNVILALGGTAMWALTGKEGITKWRGSILETRNGIKVIPSFHPADILRQWNHRSILVQDCRRVLRESQFQEIKKPIWHFLVEPTLTEVMDRLDAILEWEPSLLSVDIETRNWQIACIGIAHCDTEAICIPFMHSREFDGNYWPIAHELLIIDKLKQVLEKHELIFQNGTFDCQYIARQWGFVPNICHDTMMMQHVCFPGMLGGKIDAVTGKTSKLGSSLSLSFLSSMYCRYHLYWKEDGRLFDPTTQDEIVLWKYNCEDCVRTFECATTLLRALEVYKLLDQYQFEMQLYRPVLEMMFRGIQIDIEFRQKASDAISVAIKDTLDWLECAAGHPFNPRSKEQMHNLFYRDLQLKPILHKKTKQPTLDDAALTTLAVRLPLIAPFIDKIKEYRSLGVFQSTFLKAPIDPDGRMRCNFNIAGIETFRFSSSENPFGTGTNLQNIPKGVEKQKGIE